MFRRLRSFLKSFKDEITMFLQIFIVGSSIGGLALAIFELNNATKALQAANTYQVVKDMNDLIRGNNADPTFRSILLHGGPEAHSSSFLDHLSIVMNFYLAVFILYESGGMPKGFVASLQRDFCLDLLSSARGAKEGWEALKASGRLSREHTRMREIWCG